MRSWDKSLGTLKRIIGRVVYPSKVRASQRVRRRSQLWSIGIYSGRSPIELAPHPDVTNPVLTCENVSDALARLIADPFILREGQTWYMFCEVLNQETGKGEIGLATSENATAWTYRQIVLAEPFHLSYPYIFKWKDEHYMIPESGAAGCVRLYRASRFPDRWVLANTLLSGMHFKDSSIFCLHGRWWLFTETSTEVRHDTLRLFHADAPLGPWTEHPQSPLIVGNAHIARPAGRVVVTDDRAIRYTQDCYPTYGTRVRAFEITDLTMRTYHERTASDRPVLEANGVGWNGSGMHHLDLFRVDDGQWIACVDGWVRNDA